MIKIEITVCTAHNSSISMVYEVDEKLWEVCSTKERLEMIDEFEDRLMRSLCQPTWKLLP